MSLLPIDPADFPDVPTRKALIALDFQNDFLAKDGALPVVQSDGLIDRVTSLAEALRNSGHGEVIWVRSQFDTNRTAGPQQIMASDTPQLPMRPGSSASRMQRDPDPSACFDADPEAFLSVTGGQAGKTKPQCVRKGTQGAELLPTIAATKAPRDYTMTKSYYSAFHSGQLLNLLRRQFATELYICGSLSNVSVYATALAASSHGLRITIVDDCCGYRSEMRHMNTMRKLMEQTGCEYATAGEIIPTLRPKSSSSASPKGRQSPAGPSQIPPELIAAAMIGSGGKAMPVRPRHTTSSLLNPARSNEDQQETEQDTNKEGAAVGTASTSSLSCDLSSTLDKLKLSPESIEPPHLSQSARDTPAVKSDPVVTKNEDTQSKDKQTVHPVALGKETDLEDANPKEKKETIIPKRADKVLANQVDASCGRASPRNGKASPSITVTGRGTGKAQKASNQAKEGNRLTTADSSESPYSEATLMAPTPENLLEQARANRSKGNVLPASLLASTRPSSQPVEKPNSEAGLSPKSDKDDALGMLCEGDTMLTREFLPPTLIEGLFERLCHEVHFKKMIHQGGEVPRFVAVQGQVDADGAEPVYRHPSDESPPLAPFTPAVEEIRTHVANALGHPVNHVLIQCYRNGNDYISEHSDKTLDIMKNSFIANVSLGAQRTMVFRQKRGDKKRQDEDPRSSIAEEEKAEARDYASTPASASALPQEQLSTPSKRQAIRCPMPHNSLIKMGLVTNQKWLHGIRPDKRPQHEKSQSELSWNGMRISLTFRCIATFLQPSSEPWLIWGQGATSKTAKTANPVINGQTPETISLLKAFGKENNSPDFDWEATYGHGYDVLHMKAAPRYFGCGDKIVDGRVGLMLAECGVKYARGNIGIDMNKSNKKDEDKHKGKGSKKQTSSDKPSESPSLPRDTDARSESAAFVSSIPYPIPVKYVVDDADRTTIVGDIAILLYLDTKHPKKRSAGDIEVANIYTRFAATLALEQRWKSLLVTLAEIKTQEDDIENGRNNSRKAALNSTLTRLAKRDELLVQFDSWAAAATGTKAQPSSSAAKPSTITPHHIPFHPIGGGTELSIADYALWPLLLEIAITWSTLAQDKDRDRDRDRDTSISQPAAAAAEPTTQQEEQHQKSKPTVFGYLGLQALEGYYLGFAARKSVSEVFGRLNVAVPGLLLDDGKDS